MHSFTNSETTDLEHARVAFQVLTQISNKYQVGIRIGGRSLEDYFSQTVALGSGDSITVSKSHGSRFIMLP